MNEDVFHLVYVEEYQTRKVTTLKLRRVVMFLWNEDINEHTSTLWYKPGMTYLPFASITRVPPGITRFCPISLITPPSTYISASNIRSSLTHLPPFINRRFWALWNSKWNLSVSWRDVNCKQWYLNQSTWFILI